MVESNNPETIEESAKPGQCKESQSGEKFNTKEVLEGGGEDDELVRKVMEWA